MSNPVELAKRGRLRAERIMVDSCVITRAVGPVPPMDPETGERPPRERVTVYEGQCKVQTYEPFESTPKSGEHTYTIQRYQVHLPASADDIAVDDIIEITASVIEASLVGKTYRVAGTNSKSLQTARRLLVDDSQRGVVSDGG